MPAQKNMFLLGFILALLVSVISQVARLAQTTPEGWLFCDYAGRLAALAVLVAIPSARTIAFQRSALQASWPEMLLWLIGLVILFPSLAPSLNHFVTTLIPNTRLGHYPATEGWLNIFDLTFGMFLTACHEEILFRRCARAMFNPGCGDGVALVLLTSLLFAAYHWTTGLGNMTSVFFFGIYAMYFYKRVGALWPIIVAHFLVDFIMFGGLHLLL